MTFGLRWWSFAGGGQLNPNPFLGVLYHWTGGLSAASCYLPFRGIRRWSWEIYWLVQGCFSWLVAPAIFAWLLVPGTASILHRSNHSVLFYAWLWGAMWGVGGLLFGLGVRYLGIALGYTIALGFSTAFGTLVPPLYAGELRAVLHERSGQTTLVGVGVCLLAIVISGLAGRMKELELSAAANMADNADAPGGRSEYLFGRGILVASFAGILSACFAYGLSAGRPISDAARDLLLSKGHSDLWQSLPALVVVLWGGFTTNALWCGGLLIKNRSAGQFFTSGESAGRLAKNYFFACSAGLLWYLQFFFYSMGQTKMGYYSFSSWTLHMAGTILFAMLWGVLLHEWRGTSARTKLVGAAGFTMLVLSTLIVGYGNYLKVR
jgi:L-rhamnose-H+ transport protein